MKFKTFYFIAFITLFCSNYSLSQDIYFGENQLIFVNNLVIFKGDLKIEDPTIVDFAGSTDAVLNENVEVVGTNTLESAGIFRFENSATKTVKGSLKLDVVFVVNNAETNSSIITNNGSNQSSLVNGQDASGLLVRTFGFNQPNPGINSQVYGVNALSDNPNSMYSTGVLGIAGRSIRERVGVNGQALEGVFGPLCTNFGGRFQADNASYNYALWSQSGSNPNSFAAYFVGDSYTSSNAWTASDSLLKQNIHHEQNALSMLSKLRPVTYKMRQAQFPFLGLSGELQHGFISQEVQHIFPELVKTIVHPAQYDSFGNVTAS